MSILQRSLQSLEWNQVLEHYSEHCQSAPAKAFCRALPLAESPEHAEELLALTEEARKVIEENPFSILSSLEQMDESLLRIEKESVLDGKELYGFYRLFEICANVKDVFDAERTQRTFPGLSALLKDIHEFMHPKGAIGHAIEHDGRVKDSASAKLKQLRDEERKLHSETRDRLDGIVQKAFRDGYLQDKFFDVRDGRYLVPVKNEFRNKIPGLIVESSASKATVYIEPAAIREYNDRIKQVQLFIEEEVYAILSGLSATLFPLAEAIDFAYEQITLFDLTIARGKFARSFEEIRGASRPSFSSSLYLEGLYHPLLAFVLDKEKIIRNTFYIDPDKHVLIISGPNTGGKTVLLKSIGLAGLMARAGFYLACAGQAQLPFFKKVLAQIGDAQSIELSLSSFSASIVMLKEILQQADHDALVLIDEILHATDPDEASALALAILNYLDSQKTTAIITTHLNGLKVSDGNNFVSASMEFDTAQMQPTYRLRLGIPGSSRALEIGERLGLPKKIIDAARGFLGQSHSKVNDLLNRLETKERELEGERENLLGVREHAAKETERLQQLAHTLEEQRKNFRQSALEKMQLAEREALLKVEEAVSFYKTKAESVEDRHEAALESKKRIQEIREKFQAAKETLEVRAKEEISPALPADGFEQNGNVFVKHLKSNAVLLSNPTNKNKPAEVLVGNMKIRVEWEKLTPLSKKNKPVVQVKSPYASSSYSSGGDSDCAPELYLIGKSGEDAQRELSYYLDRAARSGRPSVRIVHGHGTGTLKKIVRELLTKSSYEIKFRTGSKEEGGDGCTVVEFY